VAFIEGTPPEPRDLPVRTADGQPIRVIQRFGFDSKGEAPNRVVHCLTDITERVRVEERMRVVADLVSDVIWDHDKIAGETWCSEGFRTRYGHDPDEIAHMGDAWVELIHPEDRPGIVAALRRAEADGTGSLVNEYRFRRADGSYADRRGSCVHPARRRRQDPADDRGDGRCDGRTHRRRAPARACRHRLGRGLRIRSRASHADYRRRVPFRLRPRHRRRASDSRRRSGLHPPRGSRSCVRRFFELLEGGDRSNILEYRLRRGDGSWANVQERNVVLRNSDGTVRRAYSVLVDITEQRQSEERLRLAAQASREVIFDWDLASDRLQWSGAGQEQYGYNPSEFPGTSVNFVTRVHPEDRHILIETARALRRGDDFPEMHEAHYRLFRADGSIAHVISRSWRCAMRTGGRCAWSACYST
jgi:PAS domain S-box-containing protein